MNRNRYKGTPRDYFSDCQDGHQKVNDDQFLVTIDWLVKHIKWSPQGHTGRFTPVLTKDQCECLWIKHPALSHVGWRHETVNRVVPLWRAKRFEKRLTAAEHNRTPLAPPTTDTLDAFFS